VSGERRTAEQLRQAFDRSFAEPAHIDAEPHEDFLQTRLDGDLHLVRLTEIASLLPLGTPTQFPTPLSELLGITVSHGVIVPVYDFQALLGYPASDAPRWQMIAAARPVALAFSAFEGHLRLARSASAQRGSTQPSRLHVLEVLDAEGLARPVVSIASILKTIETMVQRGAA
jgi:purine-binding chemotaxis protein CheW